MPANASDQEKGKKPTEENSARNNFNFADAAKSSANIHNELNIAPQPVEMSEGTRAREPDEPLAEKPLQSTFVATTEHHVEGEVLCVNVSENTSLLAVGKPDCLVYIYGLKLHVTGGYADWISDGDFQLIGHKVPVTRGAFSPDRQSIVTWSPDLVLRLWNLESRNCVGIYSNTHSDVTHILFEPESFFFATIDELGYAFIWMKNDTNTNSNNRLRYVDKNYYTHALSACVFHPERAYLATGSINATVRMWNMSMGSSTVRNFLGHSEPITALAFSRCAGYLVAGAYDGLLIVWNVMDQGILRRIYHHTGGITSIAFALDSKRFAVGSNDTRMSVWDFELMVRTKGQEITADELLVGSRFSECGIIYEVRFVSDTHLMAICVDKPEESEEVGEEEEESSFSFDADEAEESGSEEF
ncbi:transcription initiation factor TFIID subunit 5-like [Drosophila obscura]|uniref:transcription initiation factor TFIID subunit 5-like n=1 Tax=Drosophila obscura TaxID=7282 RepID=UPI001BB1DBF8|nr:transcription initiation factor TFIID subunit 5-like [Drosophila obscura]